MAGTSRRWLVPEVVQTSSMDCGPAALKCLLEGFGVRVSYGRLREACQTDVDGTSIDAMEEVARQLGLDAEQVMLPSDHLLLDEAEALPAIVVVRLANGLTHFVVAWRVVGDFVQVMDPGMGRRWPTRAQFLEELYHHGMPVPADAWREYAATEDFVRPLARRLRDLGVRDPEGTLLARALADPGWHGIAALDAAARMVAAVVDAGGLTAGRQSARVLEDFVARAVAEGFDRPESVPDRFWVVRPAPPDVDETPRLQLRGAVLVRVRGRRAMAPVAEGEGQPGEAPLSPELVAALQEPPARPGLALLRMLREDGLLAPAALAAAFALSAVGAMVEALLFRGLFDVGRYLGLFHQRLGALGALALFLAALALLEVPVMAAIQRLGRGLEVRLRVAFLEKIPRLGDRYFQSRPTSDMAERGHSVHALRALPDVGGRVVRAVMSLAVTVLGIAWLDPASGWLAALVAALSVALPLAAQPFVTERDLRFRAHGGSLTKFYLDAMLGLVAVRTHGAERAVRREHELLLVEWARAGRALQRVVVLVEGLQAITGLGFTAWLLHHYLSRAADASGVLLLLYWLLALPTVGQELAGAVRQYPAHRNIALRLLEPLGAPEEGSPDEIEAAPAPAERGGGVALALEGVTVRAAGHTILEGLDLAVPAGAHVAVVGASGAGKSSFVGLLLGWHRAAGGRVLVDGELLDAARLAALRRETAWVDPAVQLWNRSFLENLLYGTTDAPPSLARVIEGADLRGVLQRLPDGLQTTLGEGGALVSGGEGQRVRLARAMLRTKARLVVLDEPFRGLDRDRRRALLARARRLWRDATLLCITHDVGETRSFPRVLVIDGGRVVEDDAPEVLAARPGSRYRALLDAEEAVRRGLWASAEWRRLWLEGGRVVERPRADGDRASAVVPRGDGAAARGGER